MTVTRSFHHRRCGRRLRPLGAMLASSAAGVLSMLSAPVPATRRPSSSLRFDRLFSSPMTRDRYRRGYRRRVRFFRRPGCFRASKCVAGRRAPWPTRPSLRHLEPHERSALRSFRRCFRSPGAKRRRSSSKTANDYLVSAFFATRTGRCVRSYALRPIAGPRPSARARATRY